MSQTIPATERLPTRGLSRIGRWLFGDRTGLVLFLATTLFVGLTWRIGPFITDNYTLYNAVTAVADGHLWVDAAPVGGSLNTPGMHSVGSRAVARNYGEVVLAVPLLWGVRLLDTVSALQVGLVALWHAVALALLVQLTRLLSWPSWTRLAGSALVVASFVLNLLLARQLPAGAPILLSLQLETALAVSFTAVLTYRLIALTRSRRTAILGGAAVAVATPIGFWATIPKRHALTGLAVVTVLYLVARSRAGASADGRSRATHFRAGAYAVVALYAWVHAAEALFVLVPLALVDLPTARFNDGRSLAVVAAGFVAGLLPFAVTNVLLSGDVLAPPRTLPDFDPALFDPTAGDVSTEAVGEEGESMFGGGPQGPLWLPRVTIEHYRAGVIDALTDLDGLTETLIATDDVAALAGDVRFRAANLAVVESAPLLGALVALPVAAVGAIGSGWRGLTARLRPVDLLAVLMGVSLLLLYLPRLPLHVQVTARYILPLFPLSVYLIARLSVVDRVLSTAGRLAVWAYAGGVLIGGQLILAFVVARDLSVGEAIQFHGLLNLALAGLVGVALLASTVDDRADPIAGVACGLAAAGGTVFVLLAAIAYFSFVGPFVLPVVETVSDLIAAA